MPEFFIWRASQILGCSYQELARDAERDGLMGLAFTLQDAENQLEEIRQAEREQQAKLNAKN